MLFDSLWGLRAPHPGSIGGCAPRTPRFTFGRRKSEPKKPPGTPRSRIPLSQLGLYQVGDISATEFRSFSNLQLWWSTMLRPAGPVKEIDVSLGVLSQTFFLYRTLGSIQRNSGQVPSMRGNPKGDRRPPLCRRGGGVHRGGTPSKGSRPYACFCLLFSREKSRPGSGPGNPREVVEQNRSYPVKKNVSLPPAPRYANQPCIGRMRRHRTIKKDGGRGRSP